MYNTFIANNNCRHIHKRGLLRPGNIYLGFCIPSLQFYKITTATTRKKKHNSFTGAFLSLTGAFIVGFEACAMVC